MNKPLMWVLGLVALALVGAFVYLRLKGTGNTPTTLPTQSAKDSMATPTPEAPQIMEEVTVSGDEFAFSPAKINLTKGKKTRIVFKNVGNTAHDLVIDELGVKTAVIAAGQEISLEVTPDKSGEFTFYCSVNSHRAKGMEGKADVE